MTLYSSALFQKTVFSSVSLETIALKDEKNSCDNSKTNYLFVKSSIF